MHVFRRGGAKWTDTVYTILSASEGAFQVSPFVSYHILNQWFQFVHVVRSEAEHDNAVLNRKVRLHVGPLRVSAGRCKCYCLTSRISDDVEFNHSSMLQPRQKPGFATGLCAQLETVARSATVESRARPGYQHCAQ